MGAVLFKGLAVLGLSARGSRPEGEPGSFAWALREPLRGPLVAGRFVGRCAGRSAGRQGALRGPTSRFVDRCSVRYYLGLGKLFRGLLLRGPLFRALPHASLCAPLRAPLRAPDRVCWSAALTRARHGTHVDALMAVQEEVLGPLRQLLYSFRTTKESETLRSKYVVGRIAQQRGDETYDQGEKRKGPRHKLHQHDAAIRLAERAAAA